MDCIKNGDRTVASSMSARRTVLRTGRSHSGVRQRCRARRSGRHRPAPTGLNETKTEPSSRTHLSTHVEDGHAHAGRCVMVPSPSAVPSPRDPEADGCRTILRLAGQALAHKLLERPQRIQVIGMVWAQGQSFGGDRPDALGHSGFSSWSVRGSGAVPRLRWCGSTLTVPSRPGGARRPPRR